MGKTIQMNILMNKMGFLSFFPSVFDFLGGGAIVR